MSENIKNTLSEHNFENLAKIANVKVDLTAKLGGTKVPLKDVLAFQNGSIVELDNKEGESIDIFIDTVLVAKGTVVAVDGSWGVKITQIVNANG